jgi:preprotein translocase subunit SecE
MTTENTISIADKAKLALAVVILGAGIWAYYWLADAALVLRLLAVIAGIALGAAVAWLSAPG